jgi:excisionase family DNA binding protein
MKPLSPRKLGEAVGVSESSLKRWIDEGRIRVSRTAGGHRRIDPAEAIRFIREAGLPLLKPQALGIPSLDLVPEAPSGQEAETHALYDALASDRPSRVRAILQSAYVAGRSPAEICDSLIAGVMERLGDLWHHDAAGIHVEHRATDLCLQGLNLIRGLIPDPEPGAPVAVGGAPPGDPYLLPSLAAALTLASEGWREINLGPDTPLDVLADRAEEAGVLLVWLSVSGEVRRDELARDLERMARRLEDGGIHLMVGGRDVAWLARRIGPRMHVGASMAELAAFAGGILAARAGTV